MSPKVTVKAISIETGGKCNNACVCFGDVVEQHVIFFPGDVQDFFENMMQHRDNHRWKEFSFENTARIIQSKFTNSCVWVIRAKRMHLKSFACYQNFVNSNTFGIPEYSGEEPEAFTHLFSLFGHACEEVFAELESKSKVKDCPITLVGFSKGGIVLNQLLYELPVVCTHERLKKFIEQIKSMYWLDSGTSGKSGAWVTDESIVNLLASMIPEVQIHLTPYQVQDKNRSWISNEKKRFVKLLQKYKCCFHHIQYFEDREPSLSDHFALLQLFLPVT